MSQGKEQEQGRGMPPNHIRAEMMKNGLSAKQMAFNISLKMGSVLSREELYRAIREAKYKPEVRPFIAEEIGLPVEVVFGTI